MAETVNEVIGIHSVDQWKQYVNKDSNARKLIVVDFTASWCPPCRFIAPIFADLAKKTPAVTFLKVDVDELKTVAEEHKVEAMPTFLFIKDGEEIDRIVGAAKDDLVAKVAQHSAPPATEATTASA